MRVLGLEAKVIVISIDILVKIMLGYRLRDEDDIKFTHGQICN